MNIGDYVRTKGGNIFKIVGGNADNWEIDIDFIKLEQTEENWYESNRYNDNGYWFNKENIIKSSPNIIDLIEYMDLLWVKHPVKLYDRDITIGLFNPVRCDGFTEFEDGTHCIILNLDYLVNVKDLKISGIITHEQIESMKYKIGE